MTLIFILCLLCFQEVAKCPGCSLNIGGRDHNQTEHTFQDDENVPWLKCFQGEEQALSGAHKMSSCQFRISFQKHRQEMISATDSTCKLLELSSPVS